RFGCGRPCQPWPGPAGGRGGGTGAGQGPGGSQAVSGARRTGGTAGKAAPAAGKPIRGKAATAPAAAQAKTAGKAPAKPRVRARAGRLSKSEVHELFSRLRELNPHPTTELEYSTPFELLVAVMLSAQATDVGVNKATRRLYPVANTPQAILDLGEDGLKRYINTIGLYNAKAANVIATCR